MLHVFLSSIVSVRGLHQFTPAIRGVILLREIGLRLAVGSLFFIKSLLPSQKIPSQKITFWTNEVVNEPSFVPWRCERLPFSNWLARQKSEKFKPFRNGRISPF